MVFLRIVGGVELGLGLPKGARRGLTPWHCARVRWCSEAG